MDIKDINKGVNWRTIPKVIKDEFSKNGHIREETYRRNDKGVMEVTYGGIMRPIFDHYKYECVDFYVNIKFIERFDEPMDLGLVFDEDLNVISYNNIKPFYIEYSKGFKKGYSEFEDTFKKDNPLFGTSNEHIAYKVYSRVLNEKKGSFPMYSTPKFRQSDLEIKIRKEKGLKLLFKLNKESFFNSGFEGGEFYKAWEIILNNPTIFESIFKANEKNENEAIDLSAITEKSCLVHPPKPKKLSEKWHALHYWFELMAHDKKPPVDFFGSFEKFELEQIGAKRCNSTGQGFYREFIKMDISNPVILKNIFGNGWKENVFKLCKNDIVTINYINEKYK